MSTVSALGNRTLDQLKVPELKEELRKRGILPKGLKKELIERLEQALLEEAQVGNFDGEHVQDDGGEDGLDVSESQKIVQSELVREDDCSNVEIVETEKHIEPESSRVSSQAVAMNDKPMSHHLPLVETLFEETLSEAEQIKTVHPKEESVEAVSPSEMRKSPVGTPLLVTTGFEIASSADMETNVIVPSVPGFNHDSDLLPGTLCEAGSQSHPALYASQDSANAHQREDSVKMQERGFSVDQSGPDLLESESYNELKSDRGLVVEAAAPSEQEDKHIPLSTSSILAEPEIPCGITDDDSLVPKATAEVELNDIEDNLSKAEVISSGAPYSSPPEVKHLAESFQDKFVKPLEPLRTLEAVVSRGIPTEDKNVEMKLPKQILVEEIPVTENFDTNAVTPGLLTKATPQRLAAPQIELGDVNREQKEINVNREQKEMISTARDERRVEPRSRFEDKPRFRESLDSQREERDYKLSDREAPRDRRDYSRSRLSQEGLAKVKEEVEKATTKDRIRAESGFRRSEPGLQKDPGEEKIHARVIKDEPGLKGDSRRIEDELNLRDLKPMDIDSGTQVGSKRKEAGEGAQQVEPLKRQRRWTSGKNLESQAEAKSLTMSTTDQTKESIPYLKTETRDSSAVRASMSVSSSSAAPSKVPVGNNADQHLAPKPTPYAFKSDDLSNGETLTKRIVPPSTRKPTTSLRIDRFLRPFTLNAVKELLAQTGSFQDFWMDHIKSHCYVTYSSVGEAIATRDALYNLQWPPVGGKTLTAEFVDPDEVKLKCQSTNEKHTASGLTAPYAVPSLKEQISTPVIGRAAGNVAAPTFAPPPPPPPQREKPVLPPKKEPEPPIPTLDDLFKKTRVKPHIYYLPLTEEQVVAKLARSKPSFNKLPTKA